MPKETIDAIYENGTLRFHTTIRLSRKLPLKNRTRLRCTLELPTTARPSMRSFGLLRTSKRVARLIAESPEFSVLGS
jgi:hypothetical protein